MKANSLLQASAVQVILISLAAFALTLSAAPSQNQPRPSWTETGSMDGARHDHSALLNSDKVLLAGGIGNSGLTKSVELDNPAEGSWSYTRSLLQRRYGATATLLASGKVLEAGGAGSDEVSTSAELYDPATGR